MTLAHFIYIPGVFAFGVLVGYLLRVKLADIAAQDGEVKDRRKAARDARRRAREGERSRDGDGDDTQAPSGPA